MELKFISRIKKSNKRGTGFLPIPKDKLFLFGLSDKVQIKFLNNVYFFAQIIEYSHKLGVYVPRSLMEKHRLLNKEVEIQIKKIRGFYAPVASDGRIYLPYDIVKNESLRDNDIISIKAIENNKIIHEKYVKIYVTTRPKRRWKEYICYLDKNLSGRTLVFQVKKLSPIPPYRRVNPLLAKLLQDMHCAFIDKNSTIIFKGNKVPAIININLELSDLAFYLGAYFADGTKKGNSWAICASTFEQASYYLRIHNSLIKDSKPEFIISYTDIDNSNQKVLKKNLARIWKDKTSIRISKFRIRKPEGKCFLKWNRYGTLVIREHRQILLDIYNFLLKRLIKEILSLRSKKLAIDFICGVMEGDGYSAANPQGSVSIWSNKNDIGILEKILRITEMKFKICKEGENKYALKIGALEILRNFYLLKDKIFILYPKRRKNLFERFKAVGAVRFLTENHSSTNWVKSWLKNNGFCDKNYQLTKLGLSLRDNLLNKMIGVK